MNQYREILTKAVIGKTHRSFETSVTMPQTKANVTKILGAIILNHDVIATRIGSKVEVTGSYDVNVWYVFDDQETEVVRTTVEYNDKVVIENALRTNILESDEIYVEEVLAPYAQDIRLENGLIQIDIGYEITVEVIGETKMRVAILGAVKTEDSIIPEISFDPDAFLPFDDLSEIDDAITDNFLGTDNMNFDF